MWTREGLEEHMRTLVAAGLFATKAAALRACLLRNRLLASYKLEWYLERRVAVLEAGGTADDVLTACTQANSLRVLLERLLYIRARCDAELGLLCKESTCGAHHARNSTVVACAAECVHTISELGCMALA